MGSNSAAMTIGKWDPSKHPRAAAGSAGGGQFAPLSYNAKSGRGTGYGSAKGDDRVRTAQQALRKAGFTDADGKPLRIDGKLGPKTTAALIKYQKAHGIKPADGKITPALLKALRKGGGPAPGPHKKAALKRSAGRKAPTPAARKAPTPMSRNPAMR